MKKTLFSLWMLLYGLAVHAQLEKGHMIIGGAASLSFPAGNNTVKSPGVSLSPEYAIIKSPTRIVGSAGTIGFSNTRWINSGIKQSTTTLGISPFIQQLVSLNDKFYVTVTGQSTLAYTSWKEVSTTTTSISGITLSASARPGILYWSGRKWLIRLDIGNARIFSYGIENEKHMESDRKTTGSILDFRTVYNFSGSQIGLYYLLK